MGTTLSSLLPVLLFAVTTSATPGPNNMMIAASGATFGIRRSVPHMAGIATGFALMLLLVTAGVGAALRSAPSAQLVLRWVGAAYLLWLAFRIATATPAAPGTARAGRPFTALNAALFQWVNPKAWMITAGAVSTYTTAEAAVFPQALTIAGVFFAVSWPCNLFWAALGAGAARLLRTPARLRAFNLAMASLLVASLIPVLAE